MNASAIASRLSSTAKRERRADAEWMTIPDLDVRAMAQLMLENESRFVTLTVIPEGDGFRFIYHWDVEGELLCVTTPIAGNVATSIVDIWPAADWVEREVRDYYAVEFSGRAETPPLMLQDGDEPGFFNRTCEISDDPAKTGWSDAFHSEKEGAR
jgi:NADH:ubiquinone oxidoreductase subunit C